jgi:N-acetylmuramoyl-L-alanine amidase
MGRLHAEAYERFKRPLDMAQGMDALQRLTNHFPRSALADDAQFMIGQIYERSGDFQRAYVEYLKVTVNFPKGDQVEAAKARLDALEAEIKRRRHQVPPREAVAAPAPARAAAHDSANGLSSLTSLRHWSTPNYTRVVANLERPVAYKATLLSIENQQHQDQPRRLYLDLKGARLGPEAAKPLAIGDGLLRSARADQLATDTVRLALDINSLGSYKVFTLDNPFRLVVDCFAQPGAAASAPPPPPAPAPAPVAAAPAPAASVPAPAAPPAAERAEKAPAKKPEPPKAEPAKPEPPALAPSSPAQTAKLKGHKVPRGAANQSPPELGLASQLGLRVRRVVLDPGHGGKDPGATCRGLVEKDLTLDIARRAAPKVAKVLGAEVLLTRSKDVFLPLEERTAFANTHEADLFVSIHINAAPQNGLSGIETYFLNLATDEASMRVAARENATTRRSISDLQVILNDLMLNSKINESNRLARALHKEMLEETRKGCSVQDLKVRQAPFYVLIGANMPAVLTEVGFITNQREAQRLADPAYRDKLAEGIAQGLQNYVRQLKIAGR